MRTKDCLAMHKRMQSFVTRQGTSWNAPGVNKFLRLEIDRAVRKAMSKMNDPVVRCPTCGDAFGVKLGIRQEKKGAGR